MTAPKCFGKEWSAHSVECKGGLDPVYLDDDGSNNRKPCSWSALCQQAQQRKEPQQLIPKGNLLQPYRAQMNSFANSLSQASHQVAQTVGNIQVRPPQQGYPQQGQYAQPQYNPQPQQAQPTIQQLVPAAQASMQQYAAMNYTAPGMQMPGYLTVPEPITPGESLVRPFIATLGRSMLKALGHAAANWFDHVPINRYPPQY